MIGRYVPPSHSNGLNPNSYHSMEQERRDCAEVVKRMGICLIAISTISMLYGSYLSLKEKLWIKEWIETITQKNDTRC